MGNGVYYLKFPDETPFGYYTFQNSTWLYHFGLDFEYFLDANDSARGAYFYDPGIKTFFYTNPVDFPFLFNFSEGDWWYYYSGTSNQRYFFDFALNDLALVYRSSG